MRLLYLAAQFNITAQDIGIPHSTATVGDGLTNAVKLLMTVVGMVSVIFIIVGGLQMSLSAGSPQRFARGRETLLYAVVGIGVAIAGLAIVTFIAGIPNR